jgi:hypothetical protein
MPTLEELIRFFKKPSKSSWHCFSDNGFFPYCHTLTLLVCGLLYDPCVANKVVDSKVLTVCFHVDDVKISHVLSKVVDDTID